MQSAEREISRCSRFSGKGSSMRFRLSAITGGVLAVLVIVLLLAVGYMTRETVEQGGDAALILPETAVIQESEIALSFQGFRPRETITLRVIDQDKEVEKQIGEFKADDRGIQEEQTVILPDWLGSGTYQVEAYGKSSRRKSAGTLYIRAKELWLVLDRYSFKNGEKLGFIAGGFEPGEDVQVFLNPEKGDPSEKPVASFSADQVGNTIWSEFEVPMIKAGGYELVIKGGNGGEQKLSRKITIEGLRPSFELSPWSGPPGSKFDVNAQGFLPKEPIELFFSKEGEAAAAFKADEFGNVWGGGPILVPYGTKGGPLPITLHGVTSLITATQSFSVIPPKPWGELSVYSGYPGTAVQFGGGGFNAGEKVMIYLGGAEGPLVSTSVTDSQGNLLQGSYYVVSATTTSPDGTVAFYFLGEMSKASTTAKFKVIQFPVPNQPQGFNR